MILEQLSSLIDVDSWSEDQTRLFEKVFTELSDPSPEDGASILQKTSIDLLYWYQVQNIIHTYLSSTNVDLNVVRALKQMLVQAPSLEYFGLLDDIILLTNKHIDQHTPQRWQTLVSCIDLLDYVHTFIMDKKQVIKLTTLSWIDQNQNIKKACEALENLMILVIRNYKNFLELVGVDQEVSQKLKTDFGIEKLTPEFSEFMQCAFASTMMSNIYHSKSKRLEFDCHLPPNEIFFKLTVIVGNDEGVYPLKFVTSTLKVMWRIVQLDLYKEFGYENARDNPYFIEACRYYNFYAQYVQVLASKQFKGDLEMDSVLGSQKLLSYFLIFLDLFVRIRTRSMQTTLFPQIVEPLIQIIEILPANNLYQVNLGCQTTALKILKFITKSQTFDDSSQLQRLILRLKKEMEILGQDLHGPCAWKPNLLVDDSLSNKVGLQHRQEFISTCFRFLCYSIIRMDPNQINVNQNFIAHSRKIIESQLFETSIKQLVFDGNGQFQNQESYQKVVDPVYLNCVQLYTYVFNDLPQKIGDFIDSGLIPTIINSLSRRIPAQPEAFTIVMKFFKMCNLNSRSMLYLLSSDCISKLFECGQNHKFLKIVTMPPGGDRMFDMRNLVHTFANDKQLIADKIYQQCIQNLEVLHKQAWEMTYEYVKTEQQQDTQAKEAYQKKQMHFEQRMEISVALLSYLCMDELEYIQDVETHDSCVIKSIKIDSCIKLLYKMMQTPIICTTAESFIFHFQESATLIIMCHGHKIFEKYTHDLENMIDAEFVKLHKILGVDDLDQVQKLPEKFNYYDLCEDDATDDQREMLKQIPNKDIFSISIAKIHVLVEMVIILDNLTRGHERLGFLNSFSEFLGRLSIVPNGFKAICKLQSLLNRCLGQQYVEGYQKSMITGQELFKKYKTQLEANFNWENFKEIDKPRNELEEARNLYYRYHINTVSCLNDKLAQQLGDKTFDFVLSEDISSNVLKCYKKIRLLMNQIRAFYNKGKCHVKEPVSIHYINFNQNSAVLVKQELQKMAELTKNMEKFDVHDVLFLAVWFDRVIPEITKLLCQKYRAGLSGIFLVDLIGKHQVLPLIFQILRWSVEQYKFFDRQDGPKPLWIAHNIQTVIRNCTEFILFLVQINYLQGSNFHNFLMPFKQDKTKQLTQQQSNKTYPVLVKQLKHFMYSEIFTPVMQEMFKDQTYLVFTGLYSPNVEKNFAKLYFMLCSGGFKENGNLFSEANVTKQMNPQNSVVQNRRNTLQREDLDHQQILTLINMGFEEERVVSALILHNGYFDYALDALVTGTVLNVPEEKKVDQPEHDEVIEDAIELSMIGCEDIEERLTCQLIKDSFISNLSQHFRHIEICQRKNFVSQLFVYYKDGSQKLKDVVLEIFQNMIEDQCVPDWLVVSYFINLLGYVQDFQQLNLSSIILKIVKSFRNLVDRLNQENSIDKNELDLYNLHVHLTLFYFIVAEMQVQQEIQNIKKLIQQEQNQFLEVKKMLGQEYLKFNWNCSELNFNGQETQMVVSIMDSVMLFLKQYSSTQYDYALNFKKGLCLVLGQAIKLLKITSSLVLPDFDFRKLFMERDGLRLLFDIKVVDKNWQSKRCHWEAERVADKELRDLLENVWNTPRDLQKWYETLIKRQMFIQFRANFKRCAEEAKYKDLAEIICNAPEPAAQPANMQIEMPQRPKTKSKSQQKAQQKTRSKSEEKKENETSQNVPQPQAAKLKRFVKKYQEHNEQSFPEFVTYYNSQVFGHVIVNFGAFLAACAKVCVLKKVDIKEEEAKEQKQEVKIMLKKQIFKELLVDPNFNPGLITRTIIKPEFKQEVTKYQQEVVNQLLEIYIQQTKGFRLDLLKSFRDAQPSPQFILLNPEPVLVANVDRKIYYFDQVQILATLTSMLVRNNSLCGVILRHNDSKTIKFIFRNIYALTAIQVCEEKVIRLQDCKEFANHHERLLSIISFFTHLMLTNFGSTRQETAVKKEISTLFIGQLAKQLSFQPQTDSAWARSAALLINYSPIWLLAKFLTMKQSEYQYSKDALSAINQKKNKYWLMQRSHLTKQLIMQCNQSSEEPFALLDKIQSVCQRLQEPDIVLFNHIKASCLSYCISVITKVMRLFENSQTMGKILKEQGPLPADYSQGESNSSYSELEEDSEEDDYSSDQSYDDQHSESSDGDDGDLGGQDIIMEQSHTWSDSWDYEEGESEAEEIEQEFEVIQTSAQPKPGADSDQSPDDEVSDRSQDNSQDDDEDDEEMSYDQENPSIVSDDDVQEPNMDYYQEDQSYDMRSQSENSDQESFSQDGDEHATYIVTDRLDRIPADLGVSTSFGVESFDRNVENFMGVQQFFSFEENAFQLPQRGMSPYAVIQDLDVIKCQQILKHDYGKFVQIAAQKRQDIMKVKKQMKEDQGIFMLHMTMILETKAPQQKQQDYVVINPDDYKEHMINKPQMLEGKPAKQNSLDLEGIDSLFLQSLSAQGLQNIADSQQIHNQITNQNSQTAEGFLLLQDLVRLLQSQSPQRRQDILNQIQNDMNQYIPQEIFNEARALYRNNRDEFMRLLNQPLRQVQQATQQQTNQPRRQRLISQDSIAISIDLQGQAEQSNIVKQEKEESTIRGTRFVQNFHTILQDLNERYEKNQEFLIVESQCDVILHQALLPTEQDTPKQMFNKVKNCVRTALTGFRLLSKELQLIQSVKILHRIPNLRTCLQLNILNMLNEEMQKFKQSIQSQTPYQSQLYTWSTEIQGQEDQMTIQNVVMFCVSTLAQMQESLQEQHGVKTKDIVEPAVKIKSDHLMNKFASFIGKIDQQYSVLESIVNNLSELFELAKQNPQIFGKISKQDQQEFQDRIIEQLCVIIKPILKEIKTKDQKIVFPALKICSLFFTFSLNKKSLVLVRQTLNDMCDSTNQKVLHQFLEQRLSSLLQNAIRQINQKTQFAGLISQITEILKIVNGISRLDQENICDEQQFLEVFKLADQIVQDEQERANHYETGLKHFIYKEEVKQLILLLFSLCEYNLKVIFQSNNTVTTSDSPIKSITPENQIQTLTKENLQSKSEPNTLEEVLKKHQIDSKDQSRFKTLLEFFFSHRKLINNFIKVNQQVINSELKKLVQMIPQILDFDTKRIIWKTELKRLHVKYKNQRFDFSIRRESCFPDSIAELGSLNLKEWRGRFGVEFKGEDGIDEGGLIKEWFSVMSKEMLNEDLALFIKSESGATYYPNPKSTVQPNYQELFTFIGKFVGKALWDQRLLDCYFVKAFYKLILGKPLTYHDLEDYDQELYKSLTWTLENPGAENLCSSFVESQDFFGVQKEIELVEGGLDLAVTDENKWEYVTLVANFRLYKAISTQVDAFLKGFYSVAPRELLKIFDNRELELLISGLQNIDVDDLRENTNYINYTANCKPVQYLWQALQEFENSERAEFIQFVTGSSKVPVEGFKGLRGLNGLAKFTIAKIPTNDQNRLPQSHTCMNQLDLPEYKDKETTKKMVLMAIKEGKMFGIL